MRRSRVLVLAAVVLVVLLSLLVSAVWADQNVPVGITDTPTPTPTGQPPVQVPVVPEASTLLLLGGSATGLAAYVALQIRARRRMS